MSIRHALIGGDPIDPATAAESPMLRTRIFTRPEHVREIWAAWDRLAILRTRPYCCPDWMMSWWEHVAPPGARLRIIAVDDGVELVGIAPCFVDRGFGGVRRCRLLGAGTCAPLDILARPGSERDVGGMVSRALGEADSPPDVIMFEGMPVDAPWPALLAEAWPRRRALRITRQFAQPAPFVELDGTSYEAWLASRSTGARKKLRYELKTMQKHGATVRLSRDAEELSRDLAAFAELHRTRWRARGGTGVLDDRVERMLAAAGSRLLEQGRFRLWSMDLDGRTISSHLFVVAGRETAYWLGGFDERERRIISSGSLTILVALQHAFNVGDQRLDLGAGGQPYKTSFTPTSRSVEWVLLVQPGPRALLARGQLARLRLRIVIAQRLSPRVKRVLRRALAWRPFSMRR